MSSSTKALDPAFQGVGQRPYPLEGTTSYMKFWCCECSLQLHLTVYDNSEYVF